MQFYSHSQDNETDQRPDEEQSLTARLYQLYANKLLSYLYHHVLSREDAEDILYEVFLVALEQEEALMLRSDDARRAWLWVVARNKASDYYRNMHRRPVVSLLHMEGQLEDERMIPEEAIMHHEATDHLQKYLKRLPPVQQEALQLRFIGGLGYAEIAQVINKREGNVRTLLSRALNTLRRMYMQENER